MHGVVVGDGYKAEKIKTRIKKLSKKADEL